MKRCFFILFLLPFLFSIDQAEASFCWDIGGTGCSFTDNDARIPYDYPVSEDELSNKKANDKGSFHKFRMRPECEDFECDNDQSFAVRLSDYQYIGSLVKPSLGEDIKLHIHNKDNGVETHDWQLNDELNGVVPGQDDYTKGAFLKLEFKKDFVDDLSTGTHKFIFFLQGDNGDGKKQTLIYTFHIRIENKVQITGLDNAPLGTFPNHEVYFQQNFCVYATGDGRESGGKFGLDGLSANGRFSNFFLKRQGSSTPKVYYIAKVGRGADASTLYNINSQTAGMTFIGSTSRDCGGHDNMTLRIELNETFQALSQLPAGTYSDVLTLTVEAY